MAAPRKPQDRQPARKTTSPRKTAAVRPATGLNLDTLQREGAPNVLPYTFVHGGKTFTLGDPAEMDLNFVFDIVTDPLGNASMFYEMLGDQYDDFRAAGALPQWKFPHLIEDWQAHYGVDVEELGKDAG